MTRKIKANEVEPGMEVQFDLGGWDVRGTVASVGFRRESVWIYTNQSCEMSLDLDDQITVLSEPAPVQPEEPTEFGAKVIVDGRRFLRAPLHSSDPTPWLSHLDGTWIKWSTILAMGPVTVVPDQGWTVPADTPKVPERIEEWPNDDTHLRGDFWRCSWGSVISYRGDGWYWWDHRNHCWHPENHPGESSSMTRTTDPSLLSTWDTPEVPDRVEEWPEDDTALRKYKWRDALGIVWRYGVTGGEHGWSCGSVLAWRNPLDGPWDRVTTTTHENKEKE